MYFSRKISYDPSKKWTLPIFSVLLIFLVLKSYYAQASLTYGIHQQYLSPRAMGMGNAFSAMADDYNAIFFNPAGLTQIPEWKLNIGLVGGGTSMGNSKFTDLYKDVSDANDKSGDAQTLALAKAVEKQYGKDFYLRLQALNTLWAKQNWGFGFIPVDFSMNLGVHNNVGPTLDIEATQDTTFAFGYGWKANFLEGLSLGATLKIINRIYFSKVLPAVELTSGSKAVSTSEANEGLTFDLDLGALYHIGEMWGIRSFASLVIRNAIDYGFPINLNILNDNTTEPPKLQRRFDIGSAFLFPSFIGISPALSIDIRDMGHDNWNLKKGLHMGAELKWELWKYLAGAFRFGLNQGYGTFGISLKTLWVLLDFVSYGEEIGTKDATKENRVYFGRLSLDF